VELSAKSRVQERRVEPAVGTFDRRLAIDSAVASFRLGKIDPPTSIEAPAPIPTSFEDAAQGGRLHVPCENAIALLLFGECFISSNHAHPRGLWQRYSRFGERRVHPHEHAPAGPHIRRFRKTWH